MNFNIKIIPVLILLPLWAICIAGTAPAADALMIEDYQIQLFTDPEPLISGETAILILKILRSQDNEPVTDGKVFIRNGDPSQAVKANGPDLKGSSEWEMATRADEFGNYALATRFEKPGNFYIKVAIFELEGKKFKPPLQVGFALKINPAIHSTAKLLFISFLLLSITITGLYLIRNSRLKSAKKAAGFNFLEIFWIKRLLQSKVIQPTLQVLLLVFLAVLLILSLFDVQDSGKNLSVIAIWTLWWTGIIFTFVLVGRLWCFMCPVGAISEWTSRFFKPRRLFPAKLRNLWLANLMFVLLTWLDIQIGVVRNPAVTGAILIGITALAIGIGMFFQRRTFCRYLCPIGGLIGIYAMFSAVELRSKDFQICRSHKRKDCYLGNKKGHGCPMFEVIPKMESNNLCNFCGECIKSCPKNNITLRTRAFFKDAWTTQNKSLDESALAVVLLGISIFVTGDMLKPWAGWMESAMTIFPAEWFGIKYQYTIEVITKSILYFTVSLLLIPGAILLSAVISNRYVGTQNHAGLKQTFIRFGYMFIPIGISMHLAHNTGHLLNEAGGIIPAMQRVLNKYTSLNTGEPNWDLAVSPLIDPANLYWIQMGLLLIFYVVALYAGYRMAINNHKDPLTAFKAVVPMIVVSFGLMVVNVYLLNLPMAPRHVH